jgi:sulfite exporter TauE/SafE
MALRSEEAGYAMTAVWEVLSAIAALIYGFSWTNIAAMCGFVYLAFLLYRMHAGSSKFSVDDLFLDRRGRADLYKVVVIVMAALTVYTVLKLLDKDAPVETLLLGALGIFVGGRFLTAYMAKADPPKSDDVKVEGQ